MLTYILCWIAYMLLCAVAYAFGMYTERTNWNNLVDKGLLPTPKEAALWKKFKIDQEKTDKLLHPEDGEPYADLSSISNAPSPLPVNAKEVKG